VSGAGSAPPAAAAPRAPAPATPSPVVAQTVVPRTGSQGATVAARPVLNEMRNRDFRWMEPEGWRAVPTDKGLTLEAPGGITQVSAAVLPKMMGTVSPQQFLGMAFGQLGYRNVQVTGVIDLPPQPSGYGAAQWRMQEFAASYVANGRSARGSWLVGIVGGWGTFDALMTGYQSPAESFDEAALWLAHIARSIVRTSELKSDYPLPKPRPLDNSGLIESWRRKGLSEDRISQARREGTDGLRADVRLQGGSLLRHAARAVGRDRRRVSQPARQHPPPRQAETRLLRTARRTGSERWNTATPVATPYLDESAIRVYLVDTEEWNAAAMSNGAVWINTGLADAMSDDELAVVIGHELAHVTHEHSRRSAKADMWSELLGAGVSLAAEAIKNDALKTTVQVAAVVATVTSLSKYSRGHEVQADRVGLRYVHEAGFDVTTWTQGLEEISGQVRRREPGRQFLSRQSLEVRRSHSQHGGRAQAELSMTAGMKGQDAAARIRIKPWFVCISFPHSGDASFWGIHDSRV